jgi:hypothetical protein
MAEKGKDFKAARIIVMFTSSSNYSSIPPNPGHTGKDLQRKTDDSLPTVTPALQPFITPFKQFQRTASQNLSS